MGLVIGGSKHIINHAYFCSNKFAPF
jgi:hypothetical protein